MDGTQAAFAARHGVLYVTVSKRLRAADPARHGIQWIVQAPLARRVAPAPTMLEVTPSRRPAPVTPAPLREPAAGVRLVLDDGVSLVFDTLPPASWVASLAAELWPC